MYADIIQEIKASAEAQSIERFIAASEKALDTAIAAAYSEILGNGFLFEPPYEEMYYFYVGVSDQMGAWKLGVTRNMEDRQAKMNSHLAHLGMEKDFIMIDGVKLPKAIAYSLEKAAKYDLAHIRVANSEWYRTDGPLPMDWHHDAANAALCDFEAWLRGLTHDHHKNRVLALRGFKGIFADVSSFDIANSLIHGFLKWHAVKPLYEVAPPQTFKFSEASA